MKIPYDVDQTNQVDITDVQLRDVYVCIDRLGLGPYPVHDVTDLAVPYWLSRYVPGHVHDDRVSAVELEPPGHLSLKKKKNVLGRRGAGS